MADEAVQLVTCWQCDPPSEWKPAQLAGHQNKHRNEKKRAEQALDSSSIPAEARVDEDGEMRPPPTGEDYQQPEIVRPIVHRPKVAVGLVPWLSMAGLAIHQRNAYDGDVVSRGIPGFIEALDDVAAENDSLYRLLEGISKGNSPNFKLALATLAIIVPILANHRPESKALRNLTGGISMIPGTNIPPLPKAPDVPQEVYDATVDITAKMKETLDNMSEDDQQAMVDVFATLPPDLIARMVDFQTSQEGMAHPEDVNVAADNGNTSEG